MPYLGSTPPAIPISGTDIEAGTISTSNIADDAVTLAKIADVNVTTAKIANDAITTAKIADVNVTTAKIADVNVTTAKIADDAITLAKLAAGTDGELITWDAAGNPAAVAVGTSTHVLTSNGTGAAPTFQEAAGGGFNLVSTANLTSQTSSTIITGFDSSSDHWQIVVTGSDCSALSDIILTLSDDNQSTFESSGYEYGMINAFSSVGAAYSNSAANWRLTNGSSSRPGPEDYGPINVIIDIYTPSKTNFYPCMTWRGITGNDNNAQPNNISGVGWRNTTGAVTDIKYAHSSGTFTGRFSLYKRVLS